MTESGIDKNYSHIIDDMFPATWDDRGVRLDNPNHTIQRNAAKRFYEAVMEPVVKDKDQQRSDHRAKLKELLTAMEVASDALKEAEIMGMEGLKQTQKMVKLWELQEINAEYQKLQSDEIQEIIGYAYARGWQSRRTVEGIRLRDEQGRILSEIAEIGQINS